MGKRAKHHDAGFDVGKAIRVLHKAALEAGALPEDPTGDWRAKDPFHTAIAHAFLHGIGVERCSRRPCRAGGLCWALYELTTYQNEQGGPRRTVAQAASATEEFRTDLRREVVLYARSIAALLKLGREQHELEARAGVTKPVHEHDAVCVVPKQLLIEVLGLLPKLDASSDALRAVLESSQLRQPRSARPSRLLLNAVYQHLKWGGLTYAEIARLVPDEHGLSHAVDRVRKRVKGPDARSLHPYEPTADEEAEVSRRRDTSS